MIVFAFPDNPSAENSKSSADFSIQLIPLLECMSIAYRFWAFRPVYLQAAEAFKPVAFCGRLWYQHLWCHYIDSYPLPCSTRNSLGSCSFKSRQSELLLLLILINFKMWNTKNTLKNLLPVLQIINHTKQAKFGQSLLYARHSRLRETVFRMFMQMQYICIVCIYAII